MSRVALVTALLPPSVGGTEILVWRLFHDHPGVVVVAGAAPPVGAAADDRADGYRALAAPTLQLTYPRLRGYRYGLAPVLGAYATAWLARSLGPLVKFLRANDVEQVVSVPHQGPFALLGLLAARRLGIPHTLYILDAWEEGATGPVERTLIELGLRWAARARDSRLAVVSPALGEHYRKAFDFQAPIWIPNPAPLAGEIPPLSAVSSPAPTPKADVVFTGGIKPFNLEVVRRVAQAIRHCRVAGKLVVTGNTAHLVEVLKRHGELHDRLEFTSLSRLEVARRQREAGVLLVATNVGDASITARGYLPGRLPEYVASRRPILLIGPENSDAARAVRHWELGRTTATQDARETARILDELLVEDRAGRAAGQHDRFLELFSRDEALHRLLGDSAPDLSAAAAALGRAFERR